MTHCTSILNEVPRKKHIYIIINFIYKFLKYILVLLIFLRGGFIFVWVSCLMCYEDMYSVPHANYKKKTEELFPLAFQRLESHTYTFQFLFVQLDNIINVGHILRICKNLRMVLGSHQLYLL
jgi:hypothetical protein